MALKAHCLCRFASVAVVVTLSVVLCSCGSDSEPPTCAGDANAFVDALRSQGMAVGEGALFRIDLIQLANAGVIETCYANNAGAPYMSWGFPPPPGHPPNEFGDGLAFGPLEVTVRLRQDEALAYIGRTPPQAAYHSYCNYVFRSYRSGSGVRVYASLGDPINHLLLRTCGTPNGRSGDPFGRDTVVVSCANRAMESRIRAALAGAGFSAAIVNVAPFPGPLVRMGWEQQSDLFNVVTRFALWSDQAAGDDFMGTLVDPVAGTHPTNPPGRLFRITPDQGIFADPYPIPQLRRRGTGTSEFWLLNDLDRLRQAILARYIPLGYVAHERDTHIWLPEGSQCIGDQMECLGENRDVAYLKTDEFTMSDSADDFVIVYGVNHERAGKATYSNVSVYGTALLNGVAGTHSRIVAGSARDYIEADQLDCRDPDLLYVIRAARGDPSLSTGTELYFGSARRGYDIPVGEPLFIGFRAYLEPATKTGPLHSELIFDRVVHFTK